MLPINVNIEPNSVRPGRGYTFHIPTIMHRQRRVYRGLPNSDFWLILLRNTYSLVSWVLEWFKYPFKYPRHTCSCSSTIETMALCIPSRHAMSCINAVRFVSGLVTFVEETVCSLFSRLAMIWASWNRLQYLCTSRIRRRSDIGISIISAWQF